MSKNDTYRGPFINLENEYSKIYLIPIFFQKLLWTNVKINNFISYGLKLGNLLRNCFLVLSFNGSQLYEGFHGHLGKMEIVSLIAPVGPFGQDMFVILPSLMWLSPVPGLLDQSSLEEGDVVLSSVSKTDRSRVVLRTSVDEKEEAEEDEELHPCNVVCKVIRR